MKERIVKTEFEYIGDRVYVQVSENDGKYVNKTTKCLTRSQVDEIIERIMLLKLEDSE